MLYILTKNLSGILLVPDLIFKVFNLNPFRDQIFRELARVIKTGGSVYAAELVLKEPQRAKKICKPDDWFSWIAGAKEGVAFLNEFKEAGFSSAEILREAHEIELNYVETKSIKLPEIEFKKSKPKIIEILKEPEQTPEKLTDALEDEETE